MRFTTEKQKYGGNYDLIEFEFNGKKKKMKKSNETQNEYHSFHLCFVIT